MHSNVLSTFLLVGVIFVLVSLTKAFEASEVTIGPVPTTPPPTAPTTLPPPTTPSPDTPTTLPPPTTPALPTTASPDDPFKDLLKNCHTINGTHDELYFRHMLCDVRCMEHYRMHDGEMSDDGIVCSHQLDYACRDGLCRPDTAYPMNISMVSNVDIDSGELNNDSKMYTMLCLGTAPNDGKLETVELPYGDRSRCSRCVTSHSESPIIGQEFKVTCQNLDKWDVVANTIMSVETFFTRTDQSDVFVNGEVFHFPSASMPPGTRIADFELISKFDPQKHFRYTWHIKWEHVFL